MHTRTHTRCQTGKSSSCWEGTDLCREPSAVHLLLLGDGEKNVVETSYGSGETNGTRQQLLRETTSDSTTEATLSMLLLIYT